MFAGFNMYTSMAHFVAKTLHLRPNDILDTWGVAELLVAYGEYVNEIADKNYKEWKSLDAQTRAKVNKPPKEIVHFVGVEDIEDE